MTVSVGWMAVFKSSKAFILLHYFAGPVTAVKMAGWPFLTAEKSFIVLVPSLVLVRLDGVAKVALIALDGLLALGVGLVAVVQGDLELVDVRFKLLLDSQSLGFGPLLCLQ